MEFAFAIDSVKNLGILDGNITAESQVGGIAGSLDSGGEIKNCYFTGTVSALIITATGAGASGYAYSWSGAGTNGETIDSINISNLSGSVSAVCTVTGTVAAPASGSFGGDPADTTPPVPLAPASGGNVSTTRRVETMSLVLYWPSAADDGTQQADLKYYVYRSTAPDIRTAEDCAANAAETLLNEGAAAGNRAAYGMTGILTARGIAFALESEIAQAQATLRDAEIGDAPANIRKKRRTSSRP